MIVNAKTDTQSSRIPSAHFRFVFVFGVPPPACRVARGGPPACHEGGEGGGGLVAKGEVPLLVARWRVPDIVI